MLINDQRLSKNACNGHATTNVCRRTLEMDMSRPTVVEERLKWTCRKPMPRRGHWCTAKSRRTSLQAVSQVAQRSPPSTNRLRAAQTCLTESNLSSLHYQHVSQAPCPLPSISRRAWKTPCVPGLPTPPCPVQFQLEGRLGSMLKWPITYSDSVFDITADA